MLPASVWLRMNRAAARRDAAVVVLDAVHTVGAFAALSLEVRAGRRMFVGNCGPCPVFAESTSSLLIRRCRFGLADESPFDLVASTRV
jgi:hypothetical protein